MFGKLLQLFPHTGNRGPPLTVRSVRDSIIYGDYKDTEYIVIITIQFFAKA